VALEVTGERCSVEVDQIPTTQETAGRMKIRFSIPYAIFLLVYFVQIIRILRFADSVRKLKKILQIPVFRIHYLGFHASLSLLILALDPLGHDLSGFGSFLLMALGSFGPLMSIGFVILFEVWIKIINGLTGNDFGFTSSLHYVSQCVSIVLVTSSTGLYMLAASNKLQALGFFMVSVDLILFATVYLIFGLRVLYFSRQARKGVQSGAGSKNVQSGFSLFRFILVSVGASLVIYFASLASIRQAVMKFRETFSSSLLSSNQINHRLQSEFFQLHPIRLAILFIIALSFRHIDKVMKNKFSSQGGNTSEQQRGRLARV
jgi:hypothetical protein